MFREVLHALLGMVLIVAAVSAQPAVPAQVTTPLDSAVRNDRDRLSWRQRFESLAERYRAAGRKRMAQRVENWVVLPGAGRQLLFLPGFAADGFLPPKNSDPLDQQFLELRQQRGAALWQAGERAAAAGNFEYAYRLIHETLRDDPRHALAQRALSPVSQQKRTPAKDRRPQSDADSTGPGADASRNRSADSWATSHRTSDRALMVGHAPIQIARGTRPDSRLGWPAGGYWRAHTPHFSLVSRADRSQTEEAAMLCEAFHCAWRQLFCQCWANPRTVTQAFAGRPVHWPGQRRHVVVLFAAREPFLEYLRRLEPQVDLATGVYRDKDRITYLYVGGDNLRATWLHELTHQLFQESGATALDAGAGGNFWLVEAVAMYCESTRFHGDYCLVGGWDAPRLQTARYRQRHEAYYVPLRELSRLTKQQLQQHADIRKLYTQSAGLSHFFMDGRHGAYRKPFLDQIHDLYRHRGPLPSLSESLQVPWPSLDQQYIKFLDVNDTDLQQLPEAGQLQELSLGFTNVTDVGLRHLSRATRLKWLDLNGLPVSDEGLKSLSPCAALKRLSLAGTRVTDEGLKTLAGQMRLEELDLSQTRISDATLAWLANNQPQLSALWLSHTGVTAVGVRSLSQLERLRELDLDGTAVTADEWQELSPLFPRLAGVDPISAAP